LPLISLCIFDPILAISSLSFSSEIVPTEKDKVSVIVVVTTEPHLYIVAP